MTHSLPSRARRRFVAPHSALLWAALLCAALLVALPAHSQSEAPSETPSADPLAPTLEGIWQGWIVYAEGEIELDMLVELASGEEGVMGGNIDIPSQRMEFYPLTTVEQDGTQVTLEFFRDSERTKNARYLFEGEVKDGGSRIEGMFTGWYDDDGRNHVPFVLERTGEAFDPRPERTTAVVESLADSGDELRERFNQDADKVRLMVLLSPKCGICLASARVIQRYVMHDIESDDLALYLVWGPMLGGEERQDAKEATAFLPDSRVVHYWTPAHDLAAQVSKPLELGEELAWDTFLLYAPGTRWAEGPPPAPSSFMHVGRSLPAERRFNGKTLAAEIRGLLAEEDSEPAGGGEGR
ncbi:MAG: hypothetical protein SX243_12495 [Acidobacteriota bacterium]|nr:hypothetical protein [Acidobacteriota bacterium]